MFNRTTYRKFYYISQMVKNHFEEHKAYYIIGLFAFLLLFTTGIFSAIKYAEVVELTDISDISLINYLKGNLSIIGLFFAHILGYFFLALLIILLSSVKWLIPIGYILFLYKSFTSAVTITFFIVLYGISGILLSVFVIIPVTLIWALAYLILLSTCTKRCFLHKKYGCSYFCNEPPSYLFAMIKISCLLFLFACILEIIFLPIISGWFLIIT